MKKIILLTLAVLMIASVAFGASVERWVRAFPVGTNGADGVGDSTYASLTGAAGAFDLEAAGAVTIKYAVAWTKSSDIDTLQITARTSMDGLNWIEIDCDTVEATGITSATYTVADSLMKYFQIYCRLAAVDNANAIRPQAISAHVIALGPNNQWIGTYGRRIQATLTE